jgi:hypothetical protein
LHHHTQGALDAQACCKANEKYSGGVGKKMEDWIKQGHQTGMRLQECFRTVQNPAIHTVVREKARSRSSYPDVIAHTKAMNAGNKHSFSVAKIDDSISTRQKSSKIWGDTR